MLTGEEANATGTVAVPRRLGPLVDILSCVDSLPSPGVELEQWLNEGEIRPDNRARAAIERSYTWHGRAATEEALPDYHLTRSVTTPGSSNLGSKPQSVTGRHSHAARAFPLPKQPRARLAP